MKLSTILCTVVATGLLAPAAPADTPVGTAFGYQGRLALEGTPHNGDTDFVFRLYNAATGGLQIGSAVTALDVPVADGLFKVELDFGPGAFDGNARWLQIEVEATLLSPRQAILPTPYATFAVNGGGSSQWSVNGTSIHYSGGNVGIGVANPQARLHVADVTSGYGVILPGLRVHQSAGTPTIVGGYSGNTADWPNHGVVIAGGGSPGNPNTATNQFGFIGSGQGNTISGDSCVIGGGRQNSALVQFDQVIGGGNGNVAQGPFSTIPGGRDNQTSASFTFAAGRRAHAAHQGAFVWADSNDVTFPSTGANQFLISAAGGVGIGTNNPSHALTVRNGVDENVIRVIGPGSFGMLGRIQFQDETGGVYLRNDVDGGLLLNVNSSLAGRFAVLGGNTGLGTAAPGAFRLAVDGTAAKTGGGSWAVYSDARLKHDFLPLTESLDRMLSLQGYSFIYNDGAIENRLALPGRQIGLLAQDVAEVFPDWVQEDEEGFLFVTERGTTALFIEALRELRAEKDAEIDSLRAELAELRAMVKQLAEHQED